MGRKGSVEHIPKKERLVKPFPREARQLAPWPFQHRELIRAPKVADPVDREALTNTLNRIHFMNGHILVHLRHPRYDESIVVRAYPDACLGSELTCRWSEEELSGIEPENYEFLHLVIADGQVMILVPAVSNKVNKDYLAVYLPTTSYAIGKRRSRRYACRKGVDVQLMQGGFQARGELLDFSPVGFRIRIRPEPSSSFWWFNSGAVCTVHLRNDQNVLFSGTCRCIRQWSEPHDREIVLVPVDERISWFKRKEFRNPRQHLVPSPTLIFDHPLIKKRVQLEVYDISTSGFSVFEKADEGVLMPGMMIPEMTIQFAGAMRLKCSAQVTYLSEDEGKGMRCGIAILDMDINAYSRLTHMLTNALDPHAHISTEVDMDALWEFFFDTGFINPKKYRLIQSYRKDFKETYRRLYQENPEIAGYFTYQENGRIYGHISMVRAYERSWMIQHHAARPMGRGHPGLMVLKQIMYYMNDIYRLPSAKMDYLMVYFRPDNKFPDKVFGGFARALRNNRGCSMDLFSYLPYTSLSLGVQLPDGWSLKECSILDLWELNRFYNHYSGGLLLDALGLGEGDSGDGPLQEIYSHLGFLRKRRAYGLKYKGELNAVLIVDQSDLGLNLSELLNSIKILVTNPDSLPWGILSIVIPQLAGMYQADRIPILFYPFDYVRAKNIPYERQYQLWIFDARLVSQFMEYMQRKFRISYD